MKLRPRKGMWDLSDSGGTTVETVSPEGVSDGSGVPVTTTTPLKKASAALGGKPEAHEPELHVNFDDLDIDPPYADEFKKKFGKYPSLCVSKYCKLPVRYIKDGKRKFTMKPFEVGAEFTVTGLEAGKRVEFNVLCTYGGDTLVLEPKMIEKFCKVISPYHFSFAPGGATPAVKPPPRSSKRDPKAEKRWKEILEKRKREAVFVI